MKRFLLSLTIVVVIIIGALVAYRVNAALDRKSDAAAGVVQKPPSVAVAIVDKKELPDIIAMTGVVRAQNEAAIFAKMPGRVTKVLVEVGQVVKAGDTLALLEANDLALRIKQSDAQLRAAQAGIETARVQQQSATTSWERAQGLHKKGALSQADYEQAQASFQLAGAGVQSGSAQLALAEAALGLARNAYSDSRITSPIAGVVAKKDIDVGAQVSPGQAAFVVQDQSTLKMQGTVPASGVSRLKKGVPVRVTVDELPGRVLEGTLTTVSPTLEQASRRAVVEVSLAPAEGLLPYMFGHAEISFGEEREVLVVPATAVLSSSDGASLYAVRDGKAVLVKLRLGSRIADDYVVEEGVTAGERVVISGDTGLRDGIAVAIAGET